jgi:cation transport ATPase
VLDKTGTVTTGTMSLADVVAAPGEDPEQVLRLAGSAEDASSHPIAAAIAGGARQRLGHDLYGAGVHPAGGQHGPADMTMYDRGA